MYYTNNSIIKHKVGLLNLAEELQNGVITENIENNTLNPTLNTLLAIRTEEAGYQAFYLK